MSSLKVKVSVTLSADLLARIDAEARRRGDASRSGIIDEWLRRATSAELQARLQTETIAYYQALTDGERAEDARFSYASGGLARRLDVDGPAPVPARRRRPIKKRR